MPINARICYFCARVGKNLIRNNALFEVLKWLLFALYASSVLYIVFFARRRYNVYWNTGLVNLVPLRNTIRAFDESKSPGWDFFTNLFGNVLMFIPLPFFMRYNLKINNQKVLITAGCFLSICIEIAQYHWRIGIPDIDDVILNTSGAITGVALLHLSDIYKRKAE